MQVRAQSDGGDTQMTMRGRKCSMRGSKSSTGPVGWMRWKSVVQEDGSSLGLGEVA